MTNRINSPLFASELAAAGVTCLTHWQSDGVMFFADGTSDADRAKAEVVLAAHDPSKPAPPAPPAPFALPQATVVHRMTDDELTLFDAALASPAQIRMRRLWVDEKVIPSDGPTFALLRPALAKAFGEARAAELLAAPAA